MEDDKEHASCIKKEYEDESDGLSKKVIKTEESENVIMKSENGIKSEEDCKMETPPPPPENNSNIIKIEKKKVHFEEVMKEEEIDNSSKMSNSRCTWVQPIIQPLLTHIYQRALLEESHENLNVVFKVNKNVKKNLCML